jgi:hypothetical protein
MGISPLTDQRLAGFVMMGEQAITLGTCAFILYRRIPRVSATKTDWSGYTQARAEDQ